MQANYAMFLRRIEKTRDVINNCFVRITVVPSQPGHTTQKCIEFETDETFQLGTFAGKIIENVIPELDTFIDTNLVPEGGDKLCDAPCGKFLSKRSLWIRGRSNYDNVCELRICQKKCDGRDGVSGQG